MSWRAWFLALLAVAALVALVAHLGELEGFARLVERARPGWLFVALLLQLTTYVSVATGWRAVLERAGHPPHYAPLVRIAFGKLFADQALPTAGMGGNVLLVDQLIRLGVARGAAVAALLVSMLGFYASYAVFAVAALLLLWVHGHATPLMTGVVTALILVAVAIPALALWLRSRGGRPLPPALERIRPIRSLLETVAEAPSRLLRDRRLLLTVAGCNALVFAADILTLFACVQAMGANANPSTALIAFILASIAVTLGPIPLGLGSFELVSTSTLTLLGVAVEPAIAATLLLRLLTLWLPLVPGLVLIRTMAKPPRHR